MQQLEYDLDLYNIVAVDNFKSIQAFGVQVETRRKWLNDKGQYGALEEFSSSVRTGKADEGADALAGLRATAIAEAAVKSAVEQTFVSIDAHIRERATLAGGGAEGAQA